MAGTGVVAGAVSGAIVGGTGGTFVVPGVGTVAGAGSGAIVGGTAGGIAGGIVGAGRDLISLGHMARDLKSKAKDIIVSVLIALGGGKTDIEVPPPPPAVQEDKPKKGGDSDGSPSGGS